MRTYVKKILITLFILVSSAMLGGILLILVYCLPTDRITRHVASGVETFLTEGATFEYASGYKAAILDNVTDATMLGETVFPASQEPITSAMSAPRYLYFDSSSPELSLMGYINNNTSERSVVTYPRYWHGYLIFLKPFFLFFDFADSRMFHLGLQTILIVTLISLLYRRKLVQYLIPFTLLIVLWNPASIGMCMQYYACFYLSFLSMIIILWKADYLLKNTFYFNILFLITGICTSYFDFLTYPIATLGLPLCIWLLLVPYNKKNLFHLITNAVFWAIGYLGMWVEKWILSSVILKENILQDAIVNIAFRTSTTVDANQINRIDTIFYILRTLIKWPYVIFFGIPFLFILSRGICKNIRTNTGISMEKYVKLVLFILIALIPCAWFFVTANHAYIHPRLVYRNCGVSLFALFSGIIVLFEDNPYTAPEPQKSEKPVKS